jgi:hypothetical protein
MEDKSVVSRQEIGHPGVKTFIVTQDGMVYEKTLGLTPVGELRSEA